MILILEMVIAAIAVVLILLSLKTLQAIQHLGVGKSFWTPVAASGFLFFFGSIVAILFELNISLTEYTDAVVQISRILALSILAVGVTSYSRKVTKNLAVNLNPQARVNRANTNVETEAPIDAFVSAPPPIQERLTQQNPEREVEPECGHKFGHLHTLPRDQPIPDECLSCYRIIDCKHGLAKTEEAKTEESQVESTLDESADQRY